MKLIERINPGPLSGIDSMIQEGDEIVAIISTIIKNASSNTKLHL